MYGRWFWLNFHQSHRGTKFCKNIRCSTCPRIVPFTNDFVELPSGEIKQLHVQGDCDSAPVVYMITTHEEDGTSFVLQVFDLGDDALEIFLILLLSFAEWDAGVVHQRLRGPPLDLRIDLDILK